MDDYLKIGDPKLSSNFRQPVVKRGVWGTLILRPPPVCIRLVCKWIDDDQCLAMMEEWKVRHRWSSLECVKQDVLYPMYVLSPDSRNTSDWHTEKQHSHLNFHHPTSHPTDIPQIFLEYLCFHIIHPSLPPPPPPLGRPKQGDLGSVGDFAAGSEMAFCTLLQRSYAVLGARMHYGHPDLMNKQHLGRVRAGGSGTVQWRIWMDFFLRLVLTGTWNLDWLSIYWE